MMATMTYAEARELSENTRVCKGAFSFSNGVLQMTCFAGYFFIANHVKWLRSRYDPLDGNYHITIYGIRGR